MSETFCYTCGYGKELRIQPPTCLCKDGYSTNLSECVQCTSPCKTCTDTGTTNCLSCVDEHYLSNTDCLSCKTGCKICDETDKNICSDCIPGYYLYTDESTGISTCNPCISPCLTCMSETFCYTCGYGESLRIQPPSCLCKDGYSTNLAECVECSHPCRTCSDIGTDKCLSCADEFYLSGTECLPCKTGCKTCDESDKNICSHCISGYYFFTDEVSGTSTCKKCQSPCLTCLSETFCYTCGFGKDKRIQPPTCGCIEGYSDNKSECIICDSPCKTCTDYGSNNCLTCVDEYYLSGTDCLPCKTGCKTCDTTDKNICSECIDRYYKDVTPDGENTTCEPCQTPCLTCLTKTFCYSKNPYIFIYLC